MEIILDLGITRAEKVKSGFQLKLTKVENKIGNVGYKYYKIGSGEKMGKRKMGTITKMTGTYMYVPSRTCSYVLYTSWNTFEIVNTFCNWKLEFCKLVIKVIAL